MASKASNASPPSNPNVADDGHVDQLQQVLCTLSMASAQQVLPQFPPERPCLGAVILMTPSFQESPNSATVGIIHPLSGFHFPFQFSPASTRMFKNSEWES